MKSRCKSRTKAGKPCGSAPMPGGLCFFHANPKKASELGRIGGRSKRHATAESGDPLPTLDTAIALRDAAGRLIADVIAGKVHPQVAAGLVPLMNLQRHAIKTADLEQRLAKVEKELFGAGGDLDDNIQGPVLECRDPKVEQVPANPVGAKGTKANGYRITTTIEPECLSESSRARRRSSTARSSLTGRNGSRRVSVAPSRRIGTAKKVSVPGAREKNRFQRRREKRQKAMKPASTARPKGALRSSLTKHTISTLFAHVLPRAKQVLSAEAENRRSIGCQPRPIHRI